jgi:hypothetical protein
MAVNDTVVAIHAEPRRSEGRLLGSFFVLIAGPCAWIVQLYSCYVLASQSCYPGSERRSALPPPLGWTRPAIAAVMIAAGVVSLLALTSSLRSHRRSRGELGPDLGEVIRTAAERTCFLSLWGIVFNAGAALGSVLTFFAYFVLPACAG